jgi:hypothetical protein
MFRNQRIIAILLIFVFAFAQIPSAAWGNEGHMLVNHVAAGKLPKSMPEFFVKAADRLAWLGPEPDRWRNNAELQLKRSQEPDHFFDTENLPADFGPLPDDRYAYIHKLDGYHAKALAAGVEPRVADRLLAEKIGFQPYIALEVYGRLRVAFREYRHAVADHDATRQANAEQNAVMYAGWLGHYVADASNPMHMSVNYDGWVQENPNGYSTQRGLHSLFESKIVKDWNVKDTDLTPLMKEPIVLKSAWQDYQSYMKATLDQLEPLYKLEKAGAFKDNGTAEGHAFLNTRLAAGAQMLANMWYTAWMESAVDPPDPFARPVEEKKPEVKK